MIIQPFISILALGTLIVTFKRFKKGALSRAGFCFWVIFWVMTGIVVWIPQLTNRAASFLGVGRGADAVFYLAIAALFFMVFRLNGQIENLEHKLSDLVKKIALKDINDRR